MSQKVSPEVLASGLTIACGDFREMNFGAVQHIICDAPYEQRSHDATGSIRRADGVDNPKALDFMGVDDLRADLVALAKAHCSGWALWFCTAEGVGIWRDEIEKQSLKYKTPCVWIKPDAMPKFNGQGPSHGHECIVTAWCGPGYAQWNGGGKRGVFTHMVNPPDRDGRHSTEKPLNLMLELVQLFTNPGDTVCDPCMGSGTTGIACIKLGRKFVGAEIRPDYYAIARDRLNQVLRQPDFFVEIPSKPKQERLPI